MNKENFEKNHNKKNKRKKNHSGKHCSNLECFIRKYTVVILNQLNIKKIKLTKTILKKNHNKNKYVGEHFKEKNYEAKFSTSSI
jgi:hypothetical protein